MKSTITKELIEKVVEKNMDEALTLLSNALRSPSPTNSEGPMAETIEFWLNKENIHYDVYTYNEGQPNIVANMEGVGTKSFVFSGHMDVLPVCGEDDPTYNPWSGEIKDGKVYGRGASDMKGGDCAALMAMILLKRLNWKPAGKVSFALVSDEERGGEFGTLALINDGKIKADYGICMEPSDCQITVNHGGCYHFKVTVYGDGGFAPEDLHTEEYDPLNIYGGEDAIHKVEKAIFALDEFNKNVIRKKPHVNGMVSHMSITNIHGGNPKVINNYCREAYLLIDRRYIPGESPESITKELNNVLESIKTVDPFFTFKIEGGVEPDSPYLVVPEDSPVVRAIDKAHEEFYGIPAVHRTMLAGSDAAYISKYCNTNIPWYGPGAHEYGIAAKGEYVPIENYKNCIKIYMHVLVNLMS